MVFQFYSKNGEKKMRPSSGKKKTEEKRKYCYHSGICRWKRDSFSNEVEITRGIDWIKVLKKSIFKKINEFNWDKLPD